MAEIGVEMLDFFQRECQLCRTLSKKLTKVKMFIVQNLRAKTQQSCPNQTSPRLFYDVRKMSNLSENVGN